MDIADAQEVALKAQLKAAEATIHKLKDDAARTKKLVAETRAICANDVRKRDRQIEGLKKAVAEAGRARGERKSAGITTIQVTGDFGGDEMDDDYDLRQESNGHLAQLAKGLSEENDKMKALMHQTFDSLKKMSGWSKDEHESTVSVAGAANGASQAIAPPANPEELATDLQSVVLYVHNIISNPSYVPIEEFNEEVEVRDREIFRLRDGWEKMEIRWQDAVRLIDGWRRRMAADGRPVDMEELKMGLRLSPVRVPDFEGTAQEEPFKLSTLLEEEEEQSSFAQRQGSPSPPESLHLVPADDYQDMVPEYANDQNLLDDSDSESSIFQDDVDMDDESEEPNFEILQHSATTAEEDSPSAPLPPPPKITALEETNLAGNRKPSTMLAEKSRKRSGNLLEENFEDTAKAPVPPPHLTQIGHSPQKRLKTSRDVSHEQPSSRSSSGLYAESNSSLDSVLLLEPSPEPATTKASSRPTTTRPTRPATATSRKPASAPVKAPVKTVRHVAPEKKETPAKPLTRQRSTRATAPTASSSSSSSSRPARSKQEPSKTRSSTTTSSTTDMPPPPRPTRSSGTSSPAVVQPQSQTQPDKKSSPADTNSHRPTSSATKRSQPPPESPCRSPPRSSSRLPRKAPPHLLPTSQQSPVTVARIAAKLAASEREANAARVRAKLKAAKLGKGGIGGDSSATSSTSTAGTSSRVTSGAGSIEPTIKGGGIREVSGSTVLSSTSGSVSMDENGAAGGVSILDNDNKKTETSASSSSGASSARDMAASSEDDGGRETIVPSPAKRWIGVPPPPPPSSSSAAAADAVEAVATPRKGEEGSVVKDGKRKREVRSRAERVASRRRSTLSPWELQSLITGDVPVPPTPGGTEQEA